MDPLSVDMVFRREMVVVLSMVERVYSGLPKTSSSSDHLGTCEENNSPSRGN